jgi:hypothetical protein
MSSVGPNTDFADELARSQLAAIVASSDDAIIGKTLDGIITSWNRGAERMYGYTAQEAIGRSISMLLPADEQNEMPGILQRLQAGDRINHYQTKRRRKDGTILDISLSVSPIRDPEGRIVGAAAIGRDITELKRSEEALNRALADLRERTNELARSNAELQRFAQIASHDLQEPARTVMNFCDLLERRYQGQLDEKAREWIGFAVAGARRMQGLIAELHDYARLQSRAKPFELTDCEAVLEAAIANLHSSIEETHAEVTHDPLPTLMADASQLVQLFQNLIGNGIKFHGEQPPRIHVSGQREGDEWVFAVRDNGIGIDTRHHDHIFLLFRRLHQEQEYPGTGLGLAICKRVVEQHRGRIWVESEHGAGSVFYFALPVQTEARL